MIPILIAVLAAGFESEGMLRIPAEVTLGAMSAVEVDRDGNLYVLHRGEPPVLKFKASGEYVNGWGAGLFKVAHGLRADRAGNIWTTDNGNHVIRQFSGGGKLLRTLGEEGVAGRDETHFRSPDDLVFAGDGAIYVADSGNHRIVRLDRNGRFAGEWGRKGTGRSEFATAHGLAIDPAGRVYVADRGNKRVQVFERDGAFVAEWQGFGNPFGLLVDGSELLVSEGDINKIFHLRLSDGAILREWGDSDILRLPHLMSMGFNGRLYVAEVTGKRVQIFRRRP